MRLTENHKQFIRFCAVGFLNTISDVVLYAFFHQLLNVSPLISSTVSVFLVMSFSFMLNSWIVFKKPIDIKTYLKFLLVTATGIIVIQGLVSQLLEPVVQGYALEYFGEGQFEIFIANSLTRITGTVFSLTWNFIFYKFVVFGMRRKVKSDGDS